MMRPVLAVLRSLAFANANGQIPAKSGHTEMPDLGQSAIDSATRSGLGAGINKLDKSFL